MLRKMVDSVTSVLYNTLKLSTTLAKQEEPMILVSFVLLTINFNSDNDFTCSCTVCQTDHSLSKIVSCWLLTM
jgi:hypothetical protein